MARSAKRKAGVKLIGPKDLMPDSKLQDMGDAAIGTIVMAPTRSISTTPQNKAFNEAWHKAYGKDNYPDFMSAAGWDTMNAIFHTIKELNGKVDDGWCEVRRRAEGLVGRGPARGTSRSTRPRATSCRTSARWKCTASPTASSAPRFSAPSTQVKDECKVLKLGRCGSGQ